MRHYLTAPRSHASGYCGYHPDELNCPRFKGVCHVGAGGQLGGFLGSMPVVLVFGGRNSADGGSHAPAARRVLSWCWYNKNSTKHGAAQCEVALASCLGGATEHRGQREVGRLSAVTCGFAGRGSVCRRVPGSTAGPCEYPPVRLGWPRDGPSRLRRRPAARASAGFEVTADCTVVPA